MMPNIQYLSYTFSLLLLAAACGKDKPGQPASAFRPVQTTAPADALFQKMTSAETGIAFVNDIQETHELNIVTDAYLYNGGGVGVIDVNNDGLQDLFFTSTIVILFTVNEHNNVRVLFDRTRVTEVRKSRSATTLFDSTREL